MTFTSKKWKDYMHTNCTIIQWKFLREYTLKKQSGDLDSNPHSKWHWELCGVKSEIKEFIFCFYIKLESRRNNFINQESIRKRKGIFFKFIPSRTMLPELKRKLWTKLMGTKLSFPASTLHISAKTGGKENLLIQ